MRAEKWRMITTLYQLRAEIPLSAIDAVVPGDATMGAGPGCGESLGPAQPAIEHVVH